MDIIHEDNAVIQPLNSDWHPSDLRCIDMLRLDLLHPVISGNKWYKLKYNLQYVAEAGYTTVLTFGGAYSNHLVATAAAAKEKQVKAIAIVRGTYAAHELTPTLKDCTELGMQLVFVTREEYAKKNDEQWLQELSNQFSDPFIIPEGGANEWGRKGAEDIAKLIPAFYTHICVSIGSATTFIGLRNALPASQQLLGFVPMKNGIYLEDEISKHLQHDKNSNWQIFDKWHFGGFGKWNDELIKFMNDFYRMNSIPLDIVYTGKMMFGVRSLSFGEPFKISKCDDSGEAQASVLCIHSGGVQGNVSIKDRLFV